MTAIQGAVDSLAKAVSSGQIIDSDLNVVGKYSWKWIILSFVKCILQPFYSLFGKDAFQAYRVNAIGQSLLTRCQQHSGDLTESLKRRVVMEILQPLGHKTKGKYVEIAAITNSILTLGVSDAEKVKIQGRTSLVKNAIYNFGMQLHGELTKRTPAKSICFSPISLFPVLGMILKALSREDQQAFLRKMGLEGVDPSILHLTVREILNDLAGANGALASIRHANALAASNGGGWVQAEYVKALKDTYGANVFSISDELAQASKEINDWVAEHTDRQIPELVQAEDIRFDVKSQKVCILLNAFYFAGQWKEAFSPAVDGTFYFAKEGGKSVKMMSLKANFSCFEGKNFNMLQLPYKSPDGHVLTHLIFLPNEGVSLEALETELTFDLIQRCCACPNSCRDELIMPKINADVKVDQLFEILKEMGYPLNGSLSELGKDVQLAKIVHRARVQVDEQGTVASASTAAIGLTKSGPLPVFRVDRDYAYFIMYRGTLLFRGNVQDSGALDSRLSSK